MAQHALSSVARTVAARGRFMIRPSSPKELSGPAVATTAPSISISKFPVSTT